VLRLDKQSAGFCYAPHHHHRSHRYFLTPRACSPLAATRPRTATRPITGLGYLHHAPFARSFAQVDFLYISRTVLRLTTSTSWFPLPPSPHLPYTGFITVCLPLLSSLLSFLASFFSRSLSLTAGVAEMKYRSVKMINRHHCGNAAALLSAGLPRHARSFAALRFRGAGQRVQCLLPQFSSIRFCYGFTQIVGVRTNAADRVHP